MIGKREPRAALAAATLAAAMVVCATAADAAQAMPTFDAVRKAHVPSDVPLLDRHGETLQLLRIDKRVRRGPWVALADISPALRTAIVLGEDRRFWDHGGVDWRALAASAWVSAWNTRTRGASTLTMQLAALTDEELARPAGGRSVVAKLTQMQRARQIEAGWTKSQILEAYLNRVPLRGELVGVAAAANVLFGKQPSGLDSDEAALLAALVRAPNADAAAVERRACDVLKLQQRNCAGLAITLAQALERRPGPLLGDGGEALAPHLAQHLAAARNASDAQGATRSTLDGRLQRVALAALRRQLAELRGRNVEDGAVVVLDNASGDVLAWVGSSGPASSAADVDAVLARRQPGSTLKPLVYAQALQQRLITAASSIDDSPLQLAAGDGGATLYQPQNYDRGFKGRVSVRTALASSLNIPAVRVGAMLGPDALFDGLNRAGLRLAESGGYHGHALALGSADVTLIALANAYRMLANGGRYGAWRWQPESASASAPASASARSGGAQSDRNAATQILEPAVAFIVGDMLADPAARALTFGLDSPLVTRGWAAVKTGTSKDLRDNWCIGWTRRHTVAVWVGNAGGEAMHNVSGVSGAAPVWREVVAQLLADAPSTPPSPPAGLVRQRGEWYLAGTEPGAMRTGPATATAFGIATPRDGSVVVLDPDIPAAAQRLVFEGAAGEWRVDGQSIGRGSRISWLPRPGRHVLQRVSPEPQSAVDRVAFEVRAAPPLRARSR